MSSKSLGRIITSIGVIILVIFALADLLGIGRTPNQIGYQQLIGVVIGALVIVLGAFVSRK
jgi:hypothetical protein